MRAIWILAATGLSASVGLSGYPETEPQPGITEQNDAIFVQYRPAVARIINAALASNDAYRKLENLCVDIGHRLSGSAQLDQAIRWALDTMKKDGQENVHAEEVMVPHWVRGAESVVLILPRVERLSMLGLGCSGGNPPDGVTAPFVVFEF